MKRAMGMIETKGLIGSIAAADAMVKTSDVHLIKEEKISAALITVFVEGDVSAVKSAVEAGKDEAKQVGELVNYHIIPHPDDSIQDMMYTQKDEITQKEHIQSETTDESQIKSGKNRKSTKPETVEKTKTSDTKTASQEKKNKSEGNN